MNSFRIAYRSIRERGVASSLTMLSMALGVGLVVAVLSIFGVVSASFRNNANLGYNMIVGAKGGEEQLTLNTVYYLSKPVENIPYSYYMEFMLKGQRDEQLENSLALHAARLREETLALAGIDDDLAAPLAALLMSEVAALDARHEAGYGRNGKYGLMCQTVKPDRPGFAIPLCLGDFLGPFRVVGTTPAMFDDLVYDIENGRKYQFAQGRNFQHKSQEHGYFEAVLGAHVARELKRLVLHVPVRGTADQAQRAAKLVSGYAGVLRAEAKEGELTIDWQIGVEEDFGTWASRLEDDMHEAGATDFALGTVRRESFPLAVGDKISPAHGAPGGHLHQRNFTIVGILAPSGTPNDRAVFVNMEGFYLMEDHAKPLEEEPVAVVPGAAMPASEPETPVNAAWDDPEPLPIEKREVTALLIRNTHAAYPAGMRNSINEGPYAQAVFPVEVITRIFTIFVRPLQQILLLLTVMICIVSGISILVSIYNSMSERRHEIAVMRALGARRTHILTIVLLESVLLALGGGLLGWLAGHGLIVALAPLVEEQTGVQLGLWQWDPRLGDLAALFSVEWGGEQLGRIGTAPAETVLLPLLLLIAALVGIWPALAAYRTDVAKALGK
jgi:ABC-type lipoprotein release transport system permease subunit